MSSSPLRITLPRLYLTAPLSGDVPPTFRPNHPALAGKTALASHLMAAGVVSAHGMIQALALLSDRPGDLATILRAYGFVREPALTDAIASYHGLPRIEPLEDLPDPRLVDRFGATECLRSGVLPWRSVGTMTVIVTDRPDTIRRHHDRLSALFGDVRYALAPRASIEAALQATRGSQFRLAAETRPPPVQSCRSLPQIGRWSAALVALTVGWIAIAGTGAVVSVLTVWALVALVASMGLKSAALATTLAPAPPSVNQPAVIARLPVVSIIVALYREADIAARLVRRLGRLDYPRDLLDVILAVEEHDRLTRSALQRADLPAWIRIVVVPDGVLKTKPRALNYALDFCRGSIVGVYDAEDAPSPGQIHAVVDRFHQRGAQVACLQGVLDFYNPTENWIARCFTMEYAAWFRVILPGLDRLGLPLPLGGTTLFFRRAALEKIGAWDAHNVTEDADLGIRLYRHGYRTELLSTVTEEEANCHALAWVKQRSRWIKGYMMTWRVHMRDPVQLWRDLGPRGFLAFQVLFLGSLSHALLAPLLLSFWLIPFGLTNPVADALPRPALLGLVGLFLTCEFLNLVLGVIALRRTRHRINPLWLLTLGFYHPLATLSAYKALWEVVWRPFYWDKTCHGKPDNS